MLTMEKAQAIVAAFEGLTYQEARLMMEKICEEYEGNCRKMVFTRENAQGAAAMVANAADLTVGVPACAPRQTAMTL